MGNIPTVEYVLPAETQLCGIFSGADKWDRFADVMNIAGAPKDGVITQIDFWVLSQDRKNKAAYFSGYLRVKQIWYASALDAIGGGRGVPVLISRPGGWQGRNDVKYAGDISGEEMFARQNAQWVGNYEDPWNNVVSIGPSPVTGMLLSNLKVRYSRRGMAWITAGWKDYATGAVTYTDLQGPLAGEIYEVGTLPLGDCANTAIAKSQEPSPGGMTKNPVTIEFNPHMVGPIRSLQILWNGSGDWGGIRSFERVVCWDVDDFYNQYFSIGEGKDEAPRFATTPGIYARPFNDLKKCDPSSNNIWCVRGGAYVKMFMDKFCSDPKNTARKPCNCIAPSRAPITSPVGVDYTLARYDPIAQFLLQETPCISQTCRNAVTDTLGSDYLISPNLLNVSCGKLPDGFTVCSTAITVINSQDVKVDIGALEQRCGFSKDNPPKECLVANPPKICDRWITTTPKENGQPCTAGPDCKSTYCGADKKCAPKPTPGPKEIGDPCTTDPECKSTYCDPVTRKCAAKPQPKEIGDPCAASSECASGYCDPATSLCAANPSPAPTPFPDGHTCADDYECKSGYCDPDIGECVPRPQPKPDGAACVGNYDCKSSYCDPQKKVCAQTPVKPSFWDQYKWWIVGIIGAILILIFIAVAIRNGGKKKKETGTEEEGTELTTIRSTGD